MSQHLVRLLHARTTYINLYKRKLNASWLDALTSQELAELQVCFFSLDIEAAERTYERHSVSSHFLHLSSVFYSILCLQRIEDSLPVQTVLLFRHLAAAELTAQQKGFKPVLRSVAQKQSSTLWTVLFGPRPHIELSSEERQELYRLIHFDPQSSSAPSSTEQAPLVSLSKASVSLMCFPGLDLMTVFVFRFLSLCPTFVFGLSLNPAFSHKSGSQLCRRKLLLILSFKPQLH